jgi:sulfur carrier protein
MKGLGPVLEHGSSGCVKMIRVNGETAKWEPGMTVSSLLAGRSYTFPLIIVKINGAIVPRRDFDAHSVADGDDVEAIHLMSGG